jgi:hypothetical protein
MVFWFEFQYVSINVGELVEGTYELLPSLSTICKLADELSDSREPLGKHKTRRLPQNTQVPDFYPVNKHLSNITFVFLTPPTFFQAMRPLAESISR